MRSSIPYQLGWNAWWTGQLKRCRQQTTSDPSGPVSTPTRSCNNLLISSRKVSSIHLSSSSSSSSPDLIYFPPPPPPPFLFISKIWPRSPCISRVVRPVLQGATFKAVRCNAPSPILIMLGLFPGMLLFAPLFASMVLMFLSLALLLSSSPPLLLYSSPPLCIR